MECQYKENLMTELKKEDTEQESIFEKKEETYREKKAKERKKNKLMEVLFKTQDAIEVGNPDELTFQSKILVALGSMFMDAKKMAWQKTSSQYMPMVSNEELYAEVHDREIGSLQPKRLLAKAINKDTPQYISANLQISKLRHKIFYFNGITSAIIAVFILSVASLASTGITKTAQGVKQVQAALAQSAEEDKNNPVASKYFADVKDLSKDQLQAERANSTQNSVKRAIADYYLYKKFTEELKEKYKDSPAPEADAKNFEEAKAQINRLIPIIKAHENDRVNTTITTGDSNVK